MPVNVWVRLLLTHSSIYRWVQWEPGRLYAAYKKGILKYSEWLSINSCYFVLMLTAYDPGLIEDSTSHMTVPASGQTNSSGQHVRKSFENYRN